MTIALAYATVSAYEFDVLCNNPQAYHTSKSLHCFNKHSAVE